jgi:hypothetical protein
LAVDCTIKAFSRQETPLRRHGSVNGNFSTCMALSFMVHIRSAWLAARCGRDGRCHWYANSAQARVGAFV